jgi:hypothetical protein
MIRVDRRLLAWTVSVGVVLVGGALAVRAVWPDVLSLSGGSGVGSFFTAVSVPSLPGLPLLAANIVLSVIARRRGGRAASVGSLCLWGIGALGVLTLAVSLAPPTIFQGANSAFVMVTILLLGLAGSLPIQLMILAVLAFALIGSPRVPRAAR